MTARIDRPVTPPAFTYQPAPLRWSRYPDVKDPSIVWDGRRWHLFGTGCGCPDGLEVLHATAHELGGPWIEHQPSTLLGVDHIDEHAAPGVIADGHRLHLFLQHHFNVLGGAIEHLVSEDGGDTFVHHDEAFASVPDSGEAGVYDPDPVLIDGVPHLTYAAMSVVGQPDLYVARSRSGSWNGPWERLGKVLDHIEVTCHNQIGDDDYEWGLEGPHLVQLPDGSVLLTAVCFLAGAQPGHRQRLLLAVADEVTGPYDVVGPVLEPRQGGRGENGHGSSVVVGDHVHVLYQERAAEGRPWRILRAHVPVKELQQRSRRSESAA